MNLKQHYLIILEEELIETAQRVSKAIRFGLQEVEPGQPLTNEERIMYEYNDIVAMLELLYEGRFMKNISAMNNRQAIRSKKEKVAKYIDYSESLNLTSDNAATGVERIIYKRIAELEELNSELCDKVPILEESNKALAIKELDKVEFASGELKKVLLNIKKHFS